MNPTDNCCALGSAPTECLTTNDAAPVAGSRVIRFTAEDHRWEGVPTAEYKKPGDKVRQAIRMTLVGETGEQTAFHVRYIEMAPGGYTSREQHKHEHVVVVLRGRGQVELGGRVRELGYGDAVYVAPHEVHQFHNPTAEPFGFLCMVDAVRDLPVPVNG